MAGSVYVPRVPAVSERIAFAIDLVVRYYAHSVRCSAVPQSKQFLFICNIQIKNPNQKTYDNYNS